LKFVAVYGFRRTLFEPELVGPNLEINFVNGEEAGPVFKIAVKKQKGVQWFAISTLSP
jgi:hypothetical protein